VDRVNLPAGKAREAGATESVSLRSGPAFALLKLVGQGGPPTVSVRGPAGLRLVTPAGGQAQMEDRGAAFALADPTSDTTFVELKPHTGRYTIAVRPGSAPLRSISSSYSLPEPQVTATVSGHGIDRTLTWHATGISGQSLTFTELGANGSQVIARTTSASGTIPFRALPALPGPRTVQVTVEEHGMTRTTQDVATFAGPTMPAPATPADLVVRRSDSSLYVSWRGSGAVDHYHVLVNTTGGTMTALDSSATAIAVPNVLDSDAVSVEVTAIDGVGTQSDAASRTLDGNGVGDCSSTRAFKLELQLPPGERLSRGVVKLGDVVVAELSDGQTAVPVELSDQPRRGEALSAVATTAGGTELAGSIAVTDCDVATTDGVRVLTLKPVS
jgi:hypothetical protein